MSNRSYNSSSQWSRYQNNSYNIPRVPPNPKYITLPALKQKDLIIQKLKQFPIILIEGATGSGKTTQVPQYLLREWPSITPNNVIACTQPRKVLYYQSI